MCNPLNNEKKIYEIIEKEHLCISPVIWHLIDHHLRNDLNIISIIAESHVINKEPIPVEKGEKIIKYCEEISQFLKKLRAATNKPKAH